MLYKEEPLRVYTMTRRPHVAMNSCRYSVSTQREKGMHGCDVSNAYLRIHETRRLEVVDDCSSWMMMDSS